MSVTKKTSSAYVSNKKILSAYVSNKKTLSAYVSNKKHYLLMSVTKNIICLCQ